MLWCVVQIANNVVNKLLGMCVGTCVIILCFGGENNINHTSDITSIYDDY